MPVTASAGAYCLYRAIMLSFLALLREGRRGRRRERRRGKERGRVRWGMVQESKRDSVQCSVFSVYEPENRQ